MHTDTYINTRTQGNVYELSVVDTNFNGFIWIPLLCGFGWINIGHLKCKLVITSAWFSLEFIPVWHELYARSWMYYFRGPRDWRKEESFWTHQRGNKRGFWFLHYKQEFARCLSIKLGWQSDSLDNARLPPLAFDHSIRVLTADGWTWWSSRFCRLC